MYQVPSSRAATSLPGSQVHSIVQAQRYDSHAMRRSVSTSDVSTINRSPEQYKVQLPTALSLSGQAVAQPAMRQLLQPDDTEFIDHNLPPASSTAITAVPISSALPCEHDGSVHSNCVGVPGVAANPAPLRSGDQLVLNGESVITVDVGGTQYRTTKETLCSDKVSMASAPRR